MFKGGMEPLGAYGPLGRDSPFDWLWINISQTELLGGLLLL